MRLPGSVPRVVVVCENAETVDGLQAYFMGVGIPAQSARSLDATLDLPGETTAVVLFPDGFRRNEVVERLLVLHEKWPGLLLLIITSEPRSFATALPSDRSSSWLVVMPKPVFGWSVVDAIRLHAEAAAP